MSSMNAHATNPKSPPNQDSAGSPPDQLLWPIQVAREVYTRVDGHIGMTLTIWFASTVSFVMTLILFTSYVWPVWQRSWLTIWPAALPRSIIALPLIALLLGVLLNRVWHGRLWAVLILTVYVVLHANSYLPAPLAAQPPQSPQTAMSIPSLQLRKLGPLISERPEIIIVGAVIAVLPIMSFWCAGTLAFSFLWPSVLALLAIGNTTRHARAEQRRIKAEQAIREEAMQRELEHKKTMNQLRFQAWHDDAQALELENKLARAQIIRSLEQQRQNLELPPAESAEAIQPADDDLLRRLVNQ